MARRSPSLRAAPPAAGATYSIADLPPCKGGVSRRDFCIVTGMSLLAAACDTGPAHIFVGDGVDEAAQPDAAGVAHGPPVDGAPPDPVDMAHAPGADLAHLDAGACTPGAGAFDAGLASAINVGDAKLLSGSSYDLFLCRDAGGLYAMSARCTHDGVELQKQSTKLHCPKHGANFDLNGEFPTLPAFFPLQHYAVCVVNGNVKIDPGTGVTASARA